MLPSSCDERRGGSADAALEPRCACPPVHRRRARGCDDAPDGPACPLRERDVHTGGRAATRALPSST